MMLSEEFRRTNRIFKRELEAKITELSKKKSFVQSEQAKDDGDYLEKPDQKETVAIYGSIR